MSPAIRALPAKYLEGYWARGAPFRCYTGTSPTTSAVLDLLHSPFHICMLGLTRSCHLILNGDRSGTKKKKKKKKKQEAKDCDNMGSSAFPKSMRLHSLSSWEISCQIRKTRISR